MTEIIILLFTLGFLLFGLLPGAVVQARLHEPFWLRLLAGILVCALFPISWAIYYAGTSRHSLGEVIVSDPNRFWITLMIMVWLPSVLAHEFARRKGWKHRLGLGLSAGIVTPIFFVTVLLPLKDLVFPSPPPPGVVVNTPAALDPVKGKPPPPLLYRPPKAIDQDGKPLAYFSEECYQKMEKANAAGQLTIYSKEICPDE